MFVSVGDGSIFCPSRSDSRYAIMSVSFGDKKENPDFARPLGNKYFSIARFAKTEANLYNLKFGRTLSSVE